MQMQMPGNGRGPDDEPFRTDEELALIDETDQLPWLEGDEEPEASTVDTGRILALGLIGILVVVVILAGVWWASSYRAGGGMQDEGTVIAAPDEPYKTRPENPGGREVAGTGDTSFRVAEGQAPDGRIEDLPPVEPEGDRPQAAAPVVRETPAAPATPAGWGVQVAAYSNRAAAQAGWNQLISRFEVLQGRDYRIVEGRVDNAVVYRLQVIASDEDAADMLCENLKAAGGDCQVKR